MTQHDTPDAVEAMAARIGCQIDPTLYGGDAMLRRLHQRAMDAERERDEAIAESAANDDAAAPMRCGRWQHG